MRLQVVGLSHHTAPVEVRERVEVSKEALPAALAELRALAGVREAMLVSTCNRVEALVVTDAPGASAEALRGWFAARSGHAPPRTVPLLYRYEDEAAVRHVFRVAASLDSLVIGEPQILGQVKAGHRAASAHRAAGAVLDRLVVKACHVARRIRSETGIARAAVSVSYAAADLARRIFDRLDDKTALIVGAGEMGVLALRHLVDRGVRRVHVVNRTIGRAEEVAAAFHGTAHDLAGLPDALPLADIVISCTGASAHLVTREAVQAAMRRRRGRSMFLIDISVPRNIDPRARDVPNVYVYDIDDLQAVVEHNLGHRRSEADAAEAIVEDEVRRYQRTLGGVRATPLVRSLVRKAEAARDAEVRRTMDRFADLPEDLRGRLHGALDAMTLALTKRVLHDPIRVVKELGAAGDLDSLEAAGRLFDVEGPIMEMVGAALGEYPVADPVEEAAAPLRADTHAGAAPGERRG